MTMAGSNTNTTKVMGNRNRIVYTWNIKFELGHADARLHKHILFTALGISGNYNKHLMAIPKPGEWEYVDLRKLHHRACFET